MARIPQLLAVAGSLICLLPTVPSVAQDFDDEPKDAAPAKQTSFIDPKTWDHLMETTGTAPIVIPPESVTRQVYDARYHTWAKKRLFDPALESLKDTPEDAALKPLLERMLRLFSGTENKPLGDEAAKQIVAIINGPVRRPGIDFMAALMMIRNGHHDEAFKAWRSVADAPEDAPIPPVVRLVAQGKLLWEADHHPEIANKGAMEKRYFEIFEKSLAGPFEDDDLRWTVRWHLLSSISEARPNREKHYIDLYQKSGLPEWAKLTLIGDALKSWSWREKGSGLGGASQKDRKSADGHLKEARTALSRAWELQPDYPEAATRMIDVAKQLGAHGGPELRTWFDRSISVQCDRSDLIGNYLYACSPNWGGSLPKMLAIGRACAETRRYDTQVPTYFNEAVNRVGYELEDWRPLFHHPALSALLIETRQKCAEKAEGTALENEQFSQLGFEAWLTGDYPLAAKALDKLRSPDGRVWINRDTVDYAYRLNLNADLSLRDAVLRGGPMHEDYEAGLKALDDGKPDEAITHFQAVQAKPDPWARTLTAAELRLAEFQKNFSTGNWTPLPLSESLCWTQLDGSSEWDANSGRLRMTTSWHFSKTLFRGRLGETFELRGHFKTSRPPRQEPGGLAIYCGHPPEGTGRNNTYWWTVRIDSKDNENLFVHFAPGYEGQAEKDRKVVPWKDDHVFVYRRDHDKVSFWLEGKEIIHEMEMSENQQGGEDSAGFGFLGYQGGKTEVWGTEARKLGSDQ